MSGSASRVQSASRAHREDRDGAVPVACEPRPMGCACRPRRTATGRGSQGSWVGGCPCIRTRHSLGQAGTGRLPVGWEHVTDPLGVGDTSPRTPRCVSAGPASRRALVLHRVYQPGRPMTVRLSASVGGPVPGTAPGRSRGLARRPWRSVAVRGTQRRQVAIATSEPCASVVITAAVRGPPGAGATSDIRTLETRNSPSCSVVWAGSPPPAGTCPGAPAPGRPGCERRCAR